MMLFRDYIPQALRTKSGQLHTEVVSIQETCELLGYAEAWAFSIDAAKKGLFYGKPLPTQEQVDLAYHKIRDSFTLNGAPRTDSLHAILGMVTEVAELSAASREGNKTKKMDELGDLCWYIAIYCADNDIDFEQALKGNIAKLTARFPDKFDPARAIGKDERVEKSALEEALQPYRQPEERPYA